LVVLKTGNLDLCLTCFELTGDYAFLLGVPPTRASIFVIRREPVNHRDAIEAVVSTVGDTPVPWKWLLRPTAMELSRTNLMTIEDLAPDLFGQIVSRASADLVVGILNETRDFGLCQRLFESHFRFSDEFLDTFIWFIRTLHQRTVALSAGTLAARSIFWTLHVSPVSGIPSHA
jgi:hypothetical protein